MTRRLPLILACCLGLSACGGGGDGKTAKTKPRTVADQVRSIETCLKSPRKGMLAVFRPTVEIAQREGGAATSVAVQKTGVQLIAFPTPEAAKVGFQDAQNRLIFLQQTKPKKYAKIRATAFEVQANVLIIAPRGLPPAAGRPLSACIVRSLKR